MGDVSLNMGDGEKKVIKKFIVENIPSVIYKPYFHRINFLAVAAIGRFLRIISAITHGSTRKLQLKGASPCSN